MKICTTACALVALLLADAPIVPAAIHIVEQQATAFVPRDITIQVGDTVRWLWNSGSHTVTEGSDCDNPTPDFNGNLNMMNDQFEVTFTNAGLVDYFCIPHCLFDMFGTVNVVGASSVPIASRPGGIDLLAVPNPARDRGEIVFGLSLESDVVLTIHDANGRVVEELARGTFGSGAHRIAWSGADRNGAELPSGVYFARIQTSTAETSTAETSTAETSTAETSTAETSTAGTRSERTETLLLIH